MADAIASAHLQISATGAQAMKEFTTTQNHVARSLGRMDAEMEKFSKSVKKKFTFSDFGKDLLRGFGLGSGFAVVDTAFGLVTDQFRKQAEYSKAIEQNQREVLEIQKEIAALWMTDDQKMAAIDRDIADAQKKYKELAAPKYNSVAGGNLTPEAEGPREFTKAETKALEDQLKVINQLALQKAKMLKAGQDKTAADEAAAALKEETDIRKEQAAALNAWLDANKKQTQDMAAQKATTDAVTEAHEKAREAAAEFARQLAERDPMVAYQNQLKKIEEFLEMYPQYANDAAYAVRKLKDEMVNLALDDFFGELDRKSATMIEASSEIDQKTQEVSDSARELGYSMSYAFEDAVFQGGKLREVLQGLASDLLRIVFRNSITEPLGAALSGSLGGVGSFVKGLFAPGAADGGFRSGSKPYLVGENGPELFNPGRPGTIIPNHALAGGGGGGDSFVFNYNLASGVSRAELMPMLALQQRDTIARIVDAKRRRTAVGNAL